MKKEIADKWIAALPQYKQCQALLNDGEGYCCLGVLCEVAMENGVKIKKSRLGGRVGVAYNSEVAILPTSVIEWAGMSSDNGTFKGPHDGIMNSLSSLNDGGKSFNELAKVIERHWEIL